MNGRAWLRRSLKALHEIAAFGVAGGLAACLVVAGSAVGQAPADVVAARQAIGAIARLLLVPSLALVLVTGLLAIAANRAYHDAGWAWLKALLGLSLFEGTLLTVAAGDRAAELASLAAGGGDPAALATLLRAERSTILLLLGLSIANVVLAIWRPRLVRKRT